MQMHNPKEIRAFMLAGRAVVTLVSEKTGTRFTYRLWRKNPTMPTFVGVLRGSSNETDFQFLGTVFPDGAYHHSYKSTIGEGAPSAKAFEWVWKYIAAGRMPPMVQVWHEGRCGRCGRRLTVPESISSGIGPECAKYLGRG